MEGELIELLMGAREALNPSQRINEKRKIASKEMCLPIDDTIFQDKYASG